MYFWIINCVLTVVLCIILTGIVIPQILLIAFRNKLFDEPDERKIHHSSVPRLGGIAFKPVVFITIALLLGIDLLFGHTTMLDEILKDARSFAFAFCCIMVLYLVGMADDLIGVRYRAKFIVQILCSLMLIAGGIFINDLYGFLGLNELPKWFAYPLTILVIVFIINAINLIDGIDGLCSGLCSIACLFYGFTFFMLGHYIYSMLAFATFGVLIPFFYYNVFGNAEKHKKIFMGDTGSLTVGMMISFLSIKLAMCGMSEDIGSINPLVLAFSPLALPCLDVVRVYWHRIRNKANPFLPDKNHIHHKLLAVGMPQRAAMVTILIISTVLILFNFKLSYHNVNVNWIVLIDLLFYTVFNIWLSKRILRKHSQTTGATTTETTASDTKPTNKNQ